jgi:outer membrane protein TolC
LVDGVDILKASEEEVFAAASRVTLENRLDLMNARAQLVDSWRQLAVFANALLGTVNLQYNMSSTTPVGQARPFALGGSRYDNQLIINAQAPLVRITERNNYRASLIAYQRQRRALMEAEDLAIETVRGEVRQLRQFAENYRIQQRQVELAYLTVENSLDTFQAPPGATPAGAGGQSAAAQAASLTQQLLSAQRNLPTAQNQLLTVWINYLNTRLTLYRDLELMPLDPRGVWIDDVATSQSRRASAAGKEGAPLSGQSVPGACPAPTP